MDRKRLTLSAILILSIISVIVLFVYVQHIYFGLFIKSTAIDTEIQIIEEIVNSTNSNLTTIYYINLAKSKERNLRFLSHLDSSIYPIRVDAVTPATLPPVVKPLKCLLVMDTEYACLASHLKAIHTAYHNNEPWAIISEDDAIIVNNLDWRKLMGSAPKNWELLQIHTCCIIKKSNTGFLKHFNDASTLWIHSNDNVPSAAFYIINRKGMHKILSRHVVGYEQQDWNSIEMLNLKMSKVGCQADLLLFNNINRYICTYPFIDIEKSESTIHWSHTYNDYSHNQPQNI